MPSLFPLQNVVQLSIGLLHFGHFIECKKSAEKNKNKNPIKKPITKFILIHTIKKTEKEKILDIHDNKWYFIQSDIFITFPLINDVHNIISLIFRVVLEYQMG